MKVEKWILSVLLGAIVILGVVVTLQINRLQTVVADAAQSDYELAIGMNQLQTWMDKLYFSGTAENWPLADFYLHEIEETAEAMMMANLVKNEQPLTPLIESMMMPVVDDLEAVVDAADAEGFLRHYDMLINACNACHANTGYGYIQMQRPERPAFSNQRFEP
ncbi:MAG: hypothetical protein JJU20_09105 [Opitutales bacterium]|nr:hypothetical protein [Opitutales bacterium]